jgi:hypothetical protein
MDKASGKLDPLLASPKASMMRPMTMIWRNQREIYRPAHIKRSHTLRYVLKNRATDEVLFVCLFTLYLKEDVNEDGSIKEGVEGGKPHALTNGEGGKDDSAKEDVPEMAPVVETSPDDLD